MTNALNKGRYGRIPEQSIVLRMKIIVNDEEEPFKSNNLSQLDALCVSDLQNGDNNKQHELQISFQIKDQIDITFLSGIRNVIFIEAHLALFRLLAKLRGFLREKGLDWQAIEVKNLLQVEIRSEESKLSSAKVESVIFHISINCGRKLETSILGKRRAPNEQGHIKKKPCGR